MVGFWEEHSAGNAIAALKAKLATKTRGQRDGARASPPAREPVPGDVIHLRPMPSLSSRLQPDKNWKFSLADI